MIVVRHSINGTEEEKRFKSNTECVKHLKQLRENRMKDPYFEHMNIRNSIWELEKKMKYQRRNTKAYTVSEIKLTDLKLQLETIEMLYDITEPKELKISITHE